MQIGILSMQTNHGTLVPLTMAAAVKYVPAILVASIPVDAGRAIPSAQMEGVAMVRIISRWTLCPFIPHSLPLPTHLNSPPPPPPPSPPPFLLPLPPQSLANSFPSLSSADKSSPQFKRTFCKQPQSLNSQFK